MIIMDEDTFVRTARHQTPSDQSLLEVLDSDSHQVSKRLPETKNPDVAPLGSDLTVNSGFALRRKELKDYLNIQVIVICPEPSFERIVEAIKTSAVAGLCKNNTTNELPGTTRQTSRSKHPIIDCLMINHAVGSQVSKTYQNVGSTKKDIQGAVSPLTTRQTQILNCIAEGKTNKEIANTLRASENTIKNQVSAILLRLNANDRAHAAALAVRHGWISA